MIWFFVWQLATMFIPMGRLMVPISMVLIMGVYLYQGLYKKHIFEAVKNNVFLMLFILVGGVWCVLSLCGLAGWFDLSRDFGVDLSYLPRQAYYFYFVPLIAFVPFFKEDKAFDFIKKNRHYIMAAIYAANVINTRIIEITITPLLVICFLSLLCGKQVKKLDWLFMVAIMLVPIYNDGTGTIIILKAIYAGLFIVYNKLGQTRLVMRLATATIPVILIVSFILPQIPQLYSGINDYNTRWRAEFWEDVGSAIKDSYGVGIGYGTTYASKQFTEPQSEPLPEKNPERPFSENAEYTKEQRPYVTATHNSFVAVGLRMGVLGVALFSAFLFAIWHKLYRYKTSEWSALAFLFCGVLAIISLNVGLESPGYLNIFMVSFCVIKMRISLVDGNVETRENITIPQVPTESSTSEKEV